jgi:hypothetical protein
MQFIARQSKHIQSDIQRNWSSWNFGQDGFIGTREELDEFLELATDDLPVCVSMFEIYKCDIKKYKFGELYENYWVVIDNENASEGLSGILLNALDLDSAIIEANRRLDYFGEGIGFCATTAELVYTNGEINVFKLEDK